MLEDKRKTKSRLMNELAELRRRLAAMEDLEARFRRSERALQESEERFSLFTKYLPGAAFITDAEGTCLFTNVLAADALGVPKHALQGHRLADVFPAEVAAILEEQNRVVLSLGRPLVFEEIMPENSGRHWLTCKFPIPGEDGPALVGGISIEITDRKQDEEALRRSEEQFRSFFESAAAGMVMVGVDGRLQEANQALCRFLGYEKEELLTKGFLQVTHPEEVEDSRRTYGEILAGHRHSVDHERRFVRKDGSVVWGRVRGTWLRDSRRQPIYWISVVEDITERKQVETRLKQALADAEDSRDKIDNIIESVAGGLIVADTGGRVVLVNRAVEGLLGIPSAEALGQPLFELFDDGFFRERFLELQNSRLSGFQVDLELPAPGLKLRRVIRTRASIMRNKPGSVTGTVTILYDVTRERELDRMKNEFISTAAHELHTPLASMLGYAEFLMHPEEFGGFTLEQKREFAGEIYEKGQFLAKIIDDLLDISRIEAGRDIPLETSPVDFRKTIEKVVDRFQIHSAKHSFRMDLAPESPREFVIDENKMVQVLENLLSNAVKYSPLGGPILVEGRMAGDFYQVCVADRGIGMTTEQLGKVFEKFYRADSSNTAIRGLGLGMSIARNIVRAHGGEIRVESEPCEGTRVCFTIPASPPRQAASVNG